MASESMILKLKRGVNPAAFTGWEDHLDGDHLLKGDLEFLLSLGDPFAAGM